jgi:hypothetical protein
MGKGYIYGEGLLFGGAGSFWFAGRGGGFYPFMRGNRDSYS